MIGSDPSLSVSTEDDAFHPPDSDDPSWIETMWFPFWLPEEGITVHVRVWFSPNAGKQGGAVSAWRGAGHDLFADAWTEAFTPSPDLLDLRLARGLRIECLESLQRYRIRHASDAVELDVVFEASMAAHPVAPEESPGMFQGHLEQPGRVRGTLRFDGQSHEIDCHSVRDRSWGPRVARSNLRIGNAHGTAEGFGFFVYVNPDAEGIEHITTGYLLANGVAARITSGLRQTHWHDEVPAALEIAVRDAAGRAFSTRGECVNHAARNAGNGVYAVLNLVRWEHDGGIAWGENHDVWSEAAWLAAGRPRL
jgi:hypothetical protein